MVEERSESKVTQFDLLALALGLNHDILKFQVSMDHPDRMHVVQRQHNLVYVIPDLSLCECRIVV
jgi:fructose/tagatose bisphosphate aldolase